MTATTVYIALGSNVGDRAAALHGAIRSLETHPEVTVTATSTIIETAPVAPASGGEQGPYLNAALAARTSLSPRGLLDLCLRVEATHGRDRSRSPRWGPRSLDLDLLLYGDEVINEPGLTVPHPRLHERRFVLAPLAEIAPAAVHPVLGRSVESLLADVTSRVPEGNTGPSRA